MSVRKSWYCRTLHQTIPRLQIVNQPYLPYAFKTWTNFYTLTSQDVGESLLVTVYYPTHDAAPLIPYLWAGLAGFYEDYYNLTHGSFGNTTANIAFNATPVDGPELPTLLFQPALAGPPSQLFLGLIADSVSNGYVVVAVDHPYEQPYIQFPNGTEIYGHGVNWPEDVSPLDTKQH